MKKNKTIITAIVVLVLVGGISFYTGTKVGGSSNSSQNAGGQFSAGGANGGSGMRSGRGGQGGAGFVTGEVLSKDATSVTVKLKDGGSKIIFISASTAVQKTSAGTIDDVVVGSQITANGQSNSDGSINATIINQRPNMPQGGAQGAPQGVGAGQRQGGTTQ
jgi:hypothetical protein